MKTTVTFLGMSELDAALADLPKAVARGALHRVLRKAGEPIRAAAASLAPRDTGELADSIATSTALANKVGASEFAEALRNGGTRADAVAAMREARRDAQSAGLLTFAQVFVGPTKAKTKKDAIKRIVQEFGSKDQPPQPYMRPAWDGHQEEAVGIIKSELAGEIDRTAKRLAARRAKAAAKAALK